MHFSSSSSSVCTGCLQVEKGTQGIDGRVVNPKSKGERGTLQWSISLAGRASDDDVHQPGSMWLSDV